MRPRAIVTAAAVAGLALALTGAVASAGDGEPQLREDLVRVAGVREADGEPVTLDATLYLPEDTTPAPAVLLAHGFGGSKDSLRAQARRLAAEGYAVLAYSARGFGRSGGRIHLDSPDFEVRDARAMIDHLGKRPEVLRDGPGDPRVGVAGASYGGALALLLAGTDRRVDAVAPSITWNDLRQALLPQFATRPGDPVTPAGVTPQGPTGVFKRAWTAYFLGAAAPASAPGPSAPTPTPAVGAPSGAGGNDLAALQASCGRIDPQLCLGYVQTATTGRPTPELLALLAKNSPARVAGRITAPTLLIQGQADSLFPLSEADATAGALAAAGTDVSVVWTAGGHDGGTDETERLEGLVTRFFDRTLHGPTGHGTANGTADGTGADGPAGSGVPPFSVTVPDAVLSSADTNPVPQVREADAFPGLSGGPPLETRGLPLSGGEQLALSPPGATPAAVTSVPGVGGALAAAGAAASGAGGGGAGPGGGGDGDSDGASAAAGLSAIPGQTAGFDSAPLEEPLTIVGAPRVTVRVSSTTPDATLFASLRDVAPDGTSTLPQGLVSPVRLENLPAAGRDVTISLPAVVLDVPAGHRLRVVLSSTDSGYALPQDPRGYRIALAGDRTLTVPQVPLEVADDGGDRQLLLVAAGMLAVVLFGGAALAVRAQSRRRREVAEPDLADVPVLIRGLGKTYRNGFRAVSDLDLRVEKGQVLGLLGPNGAGKTTTLRMLMGLIHPTDGEIRLFGHRALPGAPVLSRVGAFVEGPGFLPHLTGLDNLRLYWEATGRPAADAHLAEALEVAGLGDDIDRTARTYSHGMKQRLAIAQALLGLPELLVLDEPTNGLDPPQIREMREVLARYAATGRTVVVSSHLLAEVEQTCTHAVVMHQGRLIAQGPVAELVGAATVVVVDVDDPASAAAVAAGVPGVADVEPTPTGLVVRAGAAARADLVDALVRAGLRVDRVAPQRGLEETFLTLVGEG